MTGRFRVKWRSPWLLGLLLVVSGCEEGEAPVHGDLRAALQIPYFRNSLKPQVDETWKHRDLIFERVRFQGRYGDWIPALIACVAADLPSPAIAGYAKAGGG